MTDIKQAARRKVRLGQTIGAVLWSFFGVRRSASHEADMAELNPVHVIAVGVAAAAIFVLGLIGLVRVITS
ncbi:MAG: DUF2970 domain-containing protein [Burkholderiaceae bacterium]|jgi:hypothetical protein|nr:DUF2970 domain-containing protein [Burkholderiaceae bacterium]MDP4740886.1 DUF2970 domain-containing protein [Burkholderiaceae bacterium]MDP4829553.1 DUF2970 domain-containing protein [Burkholderiaceae bacterium]MDP4919979.1 DUF2970 domain-containing protein [Burkholderiaceae bacterium]MDP5127781.1 DUF2970 domain-containing protein [Burkholderiaceae bacterium]